MCNLVVKDNSLINASYALSLVEQRLILLAIVEARADGLTITDNRKLLVSAAKYETQFNVARQAAYMALKDACASLFERRFSFEERDAKKIKQVKSRWVSQIAYIDDYAEVELMFSPAVIPLITELESRFTQYELKQISGLSSAYAVRLYELLIAWRSNGKVPEIGLQELRNKIGVLDGEYKLMHQFKQRVLDAALIQINDHTDITASYEQHKKGRVITGFSFKFKEKKPKAEPKAVKTHDTHNPLLGTEEHIYPMPLTVPDTQAERSEFLSKFNGFIQQAKVLKTPIDQLASAKELEKFKEYGFMK